MRLYNASLEFLVGHKAMTACNSLCCSEKPCLLPKQPCQSELYYLLVWS